MKVSREEATTNQKRIFDVASRFFQENGFDGRRHRRRRSQGCRHDSIAAF